MVTPNPFDLLEDYDSEDPSQLIAARQSKLSPALAQKNAPQMRQPQQRSEKYPSKPLPPDQALREMKNDKKWGGGRESEVGSMRGHGGDGFKRDFVNDENLLSNSRAPFGSFENGDTKRSFERRGYGGPRSSHPGGGVHRSGFNDVESANMDRPRRTYERRSGTGRGNEVKRDGGGRGNWGTPTDGFFPETEEVIEREKKVEKPSQEGNAAVEKRESPFNESEEKKPEEEKEMTLEEYEKVLEVKRKVLQRSKTEERKVILDKDFKSMKQLSNKMTDVFIKLGSEKDKKKDIAEKEKKAKKSVSINEFLKPSEGKKYESSSLRRGVI